MMIRPVQTVSSAPVKSDLPTKRLLPEGKPSSVDLLGSSHESAKLPQSPKSEDQFLQELLVGAEALHSQPALPKHAPVLPEFDFSEGSSELDADLAAPTRNVFAQGTSGAKHTQGVTSRELLSNPPFAESKHALMTPNGLTGASLPKLPAKQASVLAVAPQNEELRQILAEAFPAEASDAISKGESDRFEIVDGKAAIPKADVRDSEQFIALQSLPAQLKLKSLGASERQKASYAAAANPKAQLADISANGLRTRAMAKSDAALVAPLPQFKKVKPAEGNPQITPDTRIDLSQLEQVLGRGAAGELVLNQPDQQPVQIKPRLSVEGHVTTGSMARERLSSQTILGLQGAVRDLSRQGGGEIQIRLKPESLGEIKLQVATRGSQVGIRIHAENPQAARVIEQSLDSLRDRLGEQNLKLGHIEFSSNPASSLTPVVMGDQPVVETTPVWTQPTIPNTVSTDTGFAANLGNGRNQQLEQDRDEGPAVARALSSQRGLRSQAPEQAGRLNVLA